jgi:phenylacetate-CoA ligase
MAIVSRSDVDVLDVRSFDFGFSEVRAYLPSLEGRKRETRRVQQRLMRSWLTRGKELHQRVHSDPEELSRWQLERVSLLVDNVYATNKFYHRLYKSVGFRSGDILSWNDFDSLPTIDKNDIIENFELLTASNALGSEEFYVSRTSGSSGQIVTRYQDEAYIDHKMLLYLRYWEQLLGRERLPHEWLYEIYLQPPPFTSLEDNFPVFTVSLDCPPEIALEHMRRMRPVVLTTFPSYLLRMSECPVDLSELGIALIVTNSEGSTKAERELISDRLGVPVYDEYSSEELSFIAGQCRHFQYHVVEDNVHVGVLHPNSDGLGEIVVTGFMNTFLPFIRYRQGDLIQINPNSGKCVCGSQFRTVDKFLGRADQCLQEKNGEYVTPDRIMSLYDRILIPRSAHVGEFHLLQENLHYLDLFIKAPNNTQNINDEALNSFTNGLKRLFDDPALEVKLHCAARRSVVSPIE